MAAVEYEDIFTDEKPSTDDLLEELSRIREECGGFLRRYQKAVRPKRLDSAERRKAILHLLIEELVP